MTDEIEIFNLFKRLLNYLNIGYCLIINKETPNKITYTVHFTTKDENTVLILKDKTKTYKYTTITLSLETNNSSKEHIISEFLKYIKDLDFEFIFKIIVIKDDLLSPIRAKTFKIPKTIEELEIFLTVTGY